MMIERPKMTFAGGKLLIRSPCIGFRVRLRRHSCIFVKAENQYNVYQLHTTNQTQSRISDAIGNANFREDGLTSLMNQMVEFSLVLGLLELSHQYCPAEI